jgi:hypothetical protein
VLRSWFSDCKKGPGGKKTSPLDQLSPGAWDPDWTTEAIDLLTVLTRLTALEPAQAALLARIIAGQLLSADDLRAAGTRWPAVPKDRHPHYSYDSLRPAESQPARTHSAYKNAFLRLAPNAPDITARLARRGVRHECVRHEALLFRMEVRDRPSPRRRSGGVKLKAA